MLSINSTFTSTQDQGSLLEGKGVISLDDPAVQSAIINLPDHWRAIAANVKGLSPENEKILHRILERKSVFPNEDRKKLFELRSRRARRSPGPVPALREVPRSPYKADDDDPSRLATTVKTPTGEFNEVLALSQGCINASFSYLYELTPSLHTISISNEFGSLEANLKAPQVSLTVVNSGPPLYYMNFDSQGVLNIIHGGVTTTTSTAGWVFVFAVNLTMSGIDPNSPEGQAISKQIDNPGDYSISQLYTDFTTADITNPMWSLCNFNGFQWPTGTFIYFQMFIMLWLAEQTASAGSLGYTWTTQVPGVAYADAPSFPPTDLIFQCYPYYAPGQKTPTEGLGPAGDNNMLLYLEMTDLRDPPKERSLTYSGNWTTSSIPASMCISTQVFWNQFLLREDALAPLLTIMNKSTWIEATECTTYYDFFSYGWHWWWNINLPHETSFYNWDLKSDGTGWTWNKSTSLSASDGVGGFGTNAGIQTYTSNNITLVPGSNMITVSGTTQIDFQADVDTFGFDSSVWANVYNRWSFTIEMISIKEGGLQLQVNIPPNINDLFQISSETGGNWLSTGLSLGDVANSMKSFLASWDISDPLKYLAEALQKTAKFFLPGAGTLLYKNPIFNNEHDLLVEAHFNGVSDWMGRQPVRRNKISWT